MVEIKTSVKDAIASTLANAKARKSEYSSSESIAEAYYSAEDMLQFGFDVRPKVWLNPASGKCSVPFRHADGTEGWFPASKKFEGGESTADYSFGLMPDKTFVLCKNGGSCFDW
jgi:hypothetical protein